MARIRTELRGRRGDYGYDGSLAGLFAIGIGGVLLAGVALLHARAGHAALSVLELVGSFVLLVTIGNYLYATRLGKFAVWAELLDDLQLRGDERVLDMGCGRGAILSMVAKLIPRGRAVGLDLWRSVDQSGNTPGAARQNLGAEGVGDRCSLGTANMTAMPFSDAAFELVVSNLAIHNIKGRHDRLEAVDEAVRVLKPGGRVLIADLMWTGAYARRLRERGMKTVVQRRLDWRFWYGGPWLAMVPGLVTATKPADAHSRSSRI